MTRAESQERYPRGQGGSPAFKKHHQNSTRKHPERDRKRAKWWRERGKKREILGGPAEGGVRRREGGRGSKESKPTTTATTVTTTTPNQQQKWRVEAKPRSSVAPKGGGGAKGIRRVGSRRVGPVGLAKLGHDREDWQRNERHRGDRATAQRTEDHSGGFGGANTQGEAPTNTPGMHSVRDHLKESLGSGENDEVISTELAAVTKGVRGSEGNTGGGRAKSDSKTVGMRFFRVQNVFWGIQKTKVIFWDTK